MMPGRTPRRRLGSLLSWSRPSIGVGRPVTWLELRGGSMHQWALATIAVMLLAYGAVSGRLRTTPVSQAMGFVALGLLGRQPGPGPGRGRRGQSVRPPPGRGHPDPGAVL